MACQTIIIDGKAPIVCGPRPRSRRCHVCHEPAGYLRDARKAGRRTCSRAMCDEHRVSDWRRDYCQRHARQAELPL